MTHIAHHPASAGVAVPGIGAGGDHNDQVRGGRIAGFTAVLANTVVLAGTAWTLTGCTGSSPAAEPPTPTPSADPGSPADRLVGLVALAADRHYTAGYTYTPAGGSARTVTLTTARDGSWRIDVPRGGLGGGRDITVAGNRNGVFQCGLDGSAVLRPGRRCRRQRTGPLRPSDGTAVHHLDRAPRRP